MRSFMVDSSVIIEHLKGNPSAKAILELLAEYDETACINDVVASEIIFIYLKRATGKSYLTLKKEKEFVRNVEKSPVYSLLEEFKFLDVNEFVFREARRIIDEHGLLPNDAFILATAKFYRCRALVTLDSDFQEVCENEGIRVISSPEELEEELKKL
ncbi:DNA-binding protein [Thermococcus siculi]|uniref:Ribonuclease VapC n=1 Tax=Thermococcus siculi TaxID=72803 RepID=A0A2Z2MML0_9EURY|nr:type II toxin-antitoxin system VapC family toxin [Thermococcus siculi]ASJ09622.1 DNA-binding protein [Thermococcus siculi]